nr:hypothetical protein [Spirochaetota bacterium]HPI91269.1 hypothetical protein [Spirochaetota bacterium]HPR49929.1 hypothetical protein [Spirochaetota bacterium]
RYLYCHGNPVVYKDPTGHVVEMVWDVASLAMSVGELVDAVKSGSKTDVAIAAASCAVDLAAVLLPGVPGGAGAAVKATKEAGKKIGKEIAEQAVKKGVQEGGEKVVKEGTEKLAKDAAKKAKPDFYVTPSGDAIPGEFHRYASSKHAPIKDAKSGTLPAKRGGTYVSFDKIDDGIVA